MSVDTVYKCVLCSQILATKYTLAKHLRCIHRKSELLEEVEVEDLKCRSNLCQFTTLYAAELKRHEKKCILIDAEQKLAFERDKLNLEKEMLFSDFRVELTKLKTENEILQRELEKAQDIIRSLTEHAINRPTTTTTNNQQNIGTVANLKVTNFLTDYETYQRQTDPERVRALLDQHFEDYFFNGQLGLAQFMVNHVIRSHDGKMIMVCTDTSRKRFRFINADSKMEEDLKAKLLTKKLSVPVKEVCATVFDRITKRLEKEKNEKQTTFLLDKKIDHAYTQFVNILEFDIEDKGSDFLNELSALLRGSNDSIDSIENM